MTTAFSTQGFQDLLAFPFRTPEDKRKLLLGSVLGVARFIIPVLPTLFLLGYAGLIMRRMILDKAEPQMPEWHGWNEMLSLGLKIGGACFVYAFPMIGLFLLGYFGMMAPIFVDAFSGPAGHATARTLLGLQLGGMFGGMACMGIAMLFAVALAIVMPPMLAHVAATNSFAAAFHVRTWWSILRANFAGFLVAMVLTGGMFMALGLVMQVLYLTIVLCIIAPFLVAIISCYMTIIM